MDPKSFGEREVNFRELTGSPQESHRKSIRKQPADLVVCRGVR